MPELIEIGWGQDNPAFRQVFTSLFIPGASPEQVNWFNELERLSCSPVHAARTVEAFAALPTDGALALERDLTDLLTRMNRAGTASLVVPSEYLEVVVTRR